MRRARQESAPHLLDLHRALHAVAPSLGGAVAFAVATAEVDGPAAGLARLDELVSAAGDQARRFQPARAARAYLLERLGHHAEAAAAYDSAIDLTHDPAEREYLQHRRKGITSLDPAWPGTGCRSN